MQSFKICNVADVELFLRYVMVDLGLGWDFHPDDDFSAYGKPDADEPRFTDEESDELNEQIDKCFEICAKQHKDIYKLTLDMLVKLSEQHVIE